MKAHTLQTRWALISFLKILIERNSEQSESENRNTLHTVIRENPSRRSRFPFIHKGHKRKGYFCFAAVTATAAVAAAVAATVAVADSASVWWAASRSCFACLLISNLTSNAFLLALSLSHSVKACWGGYACSILSCADCAREDIKCVCVLVCMRVFGCIKAKTELALKRQRSTQRGHICLAACEF